MGRDVEGSNHYVPGVAEENDRKRESLSLVYRLRFEPISS